MLAIDKYAYINKLRYFNDHIKLWFFMIMISIALFMSNTYIHVTIFFIMGFIIVGFAKVPLKAYLKIYLLPISFILLSLLAFIFIISDTDINSLFSIKISNFFIVIREDSLLKAITLTPRALSAISCSYFLI
ncbi:MAG: CbiQ family ECF transporter T component, partial [Senegalia sp. (in: firmicutes)]